MTLCPICATPGNSRFCDTPYWTCPACGLWFQSPLPPKTYEAFHEKTVDGGFAGHLMSDHDREVNRGLADVLFYRWLRDRPGRALDIGSKYPYLAHCLRRLGCDSFGIDNIEIVPQYAQELGVPMLMADFEQIDESEIRNWSGVERFDLITLVHVFEHLYEPLAALRKLHRLVAADGCVFLRLPDHGVSGFERDLTRGHFAIHPYFHTFSSLLELLVQGGDLFTVAHTGPLEGAGQRDVILRRLEHKPIVFAGLIVKDEERDLPRCLRSIAPIVDGVVIVDTGSSDATLAIAETTIAKPVFSQTYTGASRRGENAAWQLWDFSKARNVYLNEIERRGADWVLWMDADDELLTSVNLRRALYWCEFDVFGVQIESDGQQWTQHRLWKTGLGIHYEGRCHEYPAFGGRPALDLLDTVIRHDATPKPGECANQRNLRILLEEFEESSTARTAFYIANTHKDGGRFSDAVRWYARRIAMGEGFRDEWLTAYLFMGRCQRAAGDHAAAEQTLLEAVSAERGWAEFWMELAYLAYDQGRFVHAIGYSLQAVDAPIPATQLWRETNKYTDQPSRLISWCHEHLGDLRQAYSWAIRARERIGQPDGDWDARVQRLEAALRCPHLASDCRILALHRPGAIGDVLMTLNLIPLLRARHPGCAVHYFCDTTIGASLADIMHAAGVDFIGDSNELTLRHEEFARVFNLIGYPLSEGYPEKAMARHLLQYFAAELDLEIDELPALTLGKPARPAGLPDRYATLQPKAGWSVYKNWPFERWEEVIRACPHIPVFQIGEGSERPLTGAEGAFLGSPMATTIALVANATMHIGIDSFANHLTQYLWEEQSGPPRRVPGVILWGSTQPSAAGYPHNVNLQLGLSCQPCFREDPKLSRTPRGPCINPAGQSYDDPHHACMFELQVETVVREVRQAWTRANKGAVSQLHNVA